MMLMLMMIVIAVVHFAKNLTAVGHYTMIFNTHMDPHGQKKCRIMGFKLNWIFNKLTKQTNNYKETRAERHRKNTCQHDLHHSVL